jgi:uncharacterized glyoxalase superfamily protein PhnB
MKNPMLTAANTMLIVEDVKKTAEFYRDKLGFSIDFVFEKNDEDSTPFACVRRDSYAVYFESYPSFKEDYETFEDVKVKCGIYFEVNDVDALYEELKERNVSFVWTPTTQGYGNRDMKILDYNGYQILFGTDVENK